MAENVTLPITNAEPGVDDITTVEPDTGYQRDLKTSIIAMSIVGGIVVLTILTIWIIWWKFCKSPRSRHGTERAEANIGGGGGGKKQYYDQFCVNDHQLTVNSVTAIKWDEDEKESNKSSGIDCDSHSSEPVKEEKVITGKRVFSVNKVQEKPGHPVRAANGGSVVIRLPKQYAEITRSLQAGDGKNYTLAIIDKQSQTVHNIDMRNYKLRKSVSPSSADRGAHHHHAYKNHTRRHRHRSDGHSRSSGAQSAVEMIHDSPDFSSAQRKKPIVAESADEMRTTRSLTDFSDSSGSAGERRSDSLSSHDEESGKELLPHLQTKPTNTKDAAPQSETVATTDSEKETLLHDYQ